VSVRGRRPSIVGLAVPISEGVDSDRNGVEATGAAPTLPTLMIGAAQITAQPAQGEVLYRIARLQRPGEEDFRCHREQLRRRPAPAGTPWLLQVGVSMFDTREGALQIARRRPAWVAELRLPAGKGIHLAATGSRGHRTAWGDPDVLAGCESSCDVAT